MLSCSLTEAICIHALAKRTKNTFSCLPVAKKRKEKKRKEKERKEKKIIHSTS